MNHPLKPGDKVLIRGMGLDWKETREAATILSPRKLHLPLPGEGWHIIQYADGGKMCCHESNMIAGIAA